MTPVSNDPLTFFGTLRQELLQKRRQNHPAVAYEMVGCEYADCDRRVDPARSMYMEVCKDAP